MHEFVELNHPMIAFGQQFSFSNPEIREAAFEIALDCDTVEEFKSLLNAEEVSYKAEICKHIQP